MFIAILMIVSIVLALLAWRLCSKRHILPCPVWLAWMVEMDNPFAKAHRAGEIIRAVPIKNNMSVLDVGCGPGRVLLPLAQKISAVQGLATGLDIQQGMIEKTQTKAHKLNIHNVCFIHGTIEQIPVVEQYDVILMVCVLGEIPVTIHESVMKKIVSHLKPDGIIGITETVFDPHYQRHRKVLQLMQKIGFLENQFMGNVLAYTAHFKKCF